MAPGHGAPKTAILWNALDADGRTSVLRQVHPIWSEKLLHKEMAPLIASPGGAALVQRTFADSPEDIRAIDRMLARERMGLAPN